MELNEELTASKKEIEVLRSLVTKSNADRLALDEMLTTNLRSLHEEKSKNLILKERMQELEKKLTHEKLAIEQPTVEQPVIE